MTSSKEEPGEALASTLEAPEESFLSETGRRPVTNPADAVTERAPITGTHALQRDSMLGHAYRVIERIGSGGMGAVYLVEHMELGRRFAAKVVASHYASDADAVRRLRQEARTASAIDHENIVDVTDLGQADDGSIFVIMEFLQGEDLRGRLDRAWRESRSTGGSPWLPDEEVRTIVRQVLSALSAAHRAGVVHRDLKPENIFLSRRGDRTVVKLVDFGISKIRKANEEMKITQTGQILGTPLYMAPEQSRSSVDIDGRADLYSLGCIIHELMTGRVPFIAENVYEAVVLHATQPPKPPSGLRPDLPPSLEALVLRTLTKNPDDRFGSADEMLKAWEAAWEQRDEPRASLAGGAGAASASTSSLGPSDTASRSVRRWAPAVLALGLVVAVAGGVAVMGERGADEVPDEAPTGMDPAPAAAAALDETEAAVDDLPTVDTAPEPIEPEQPALPESVRRRLETSPPGASVVIDGREVAQTPHEIELQNGEPVEVRLVRQGYVPASVTVGPDSPDPVRVGLTRRAGRPPPGRAADPSLAPW
jgi:eukaryotic-like serine/threonine-protein kinase